MLMLLAVAGDLNVTGRDSGRPSARFFVCFTLGRFDEGGALSRRLMKTLVDGACPIFRQQAVRPPVQRCGG